jgi:6-phosphogluconate dehydrogenase
MKIGLVGLGKMGYNLALNIKEHGHDVIAYDISYEKISEISKEGIIGINNYDLFKQLLEKPRIIWLMIPSGNPVDTMIDNLLLILESGDIIIDGGNSHYKDTLRRYEKLKGRGINFVDIGTSGGTDGARNGVCTMIGAEEKVFNILEPLIKDISVSGGYLHTGGNGSGHYAKMIHNGIEYGMMQAIGEGFEILKESQFNFDYGKVAGVWNNGSVIRSWLMELTENMFKKDNELENIRGIVHSSGEGLWTVEEALKLKVPTPVITESLYARYRSEKEDSFTGKVVAGLRNEFGGHAVEKK